MSSNNYVPVKLLQHELDSLLSDQCLLGRDSRLDRVLTIYHLGLIDDMQCKDLNRQICKKFPPDDELIEISCLDHASGIVTEGFTCRELSVISEMLCSRSSDLHYELERYSMKFGFDPIISDLEKRIAELIQISNKIHEMIPDQGKVV